MTQTARGTFNPLDGVIEAAKENANNDVDTNDYRDENGILICGRCGKPRETIIPHPLFPNQTLKVNCLCECREKQYAEHKEKREAEEARRRKADLIVDNALRNCRFDGAIESKELKAAKRYADKFDKLYEDNVGIIMTGETGTGKSFAAACIANQLNDGDRRAFMISMARLMNVSFEERDKILDYFRTCDLVIVDDLGTERITDFALERAFQFIDERYKAQKPLIVTTNLTADAMKSVSDLSLRRIYERILEVCVVLPFKGENYRDRLAKEKLQKANSIMASR